MAPILTWDGVGERVYETGVNKGVLYNLNGGVYDNGWAWNGLTAITETPSGAEPTAIYADNIKYLNLMSAEDFGGTIEALTYPDQFAVCDGTATPVAGVAVGGQDRKAFGLSYQTRKGNDVSANLGYKIHLVYGATASPSEKAYNTINDTPEATPFSWEFSTVGVAVTGLKNSAILTIDSTKVPAAGLTALENALYGTAGTSPRLPLPDEVITLLSGGAPTVVTATAPTATTAGVITIPTVTGVTYRRRDTNAIVTGTVTITVLNDSLVIWAAPTNGSYVFKANTDDDWSFTKTT